MMNKIFWAIVVAIVLAFSNLGVTLEFEGPLHQFFVDHLRHHQMEMAKKQPSF